MTQVPIVLLTDFGIEDGYAASMKGVILSLNPGALIVDLTHEVEPQNIFQAAFLLETVCRFFPPKTIFVSVVDPGVGSRRRILAVKTRHGLFLAPDNGLLTRVLQREKSYELRAVTNQSFFMKKISHTFHGRDCFAPTAARLAARPARFSALGPRVNDFVRLSVPGPSLRGKKMEGEILFFDRFGNAFTNIHQNDLRTSFPQVRVKGKSLGPLRRSYYEVGKGKPIALISSSGLLEIAVNHGSAERKLKLKKGSRIEIF